MALLETTDLTVTFGGLNANDGVNIEVEEGSFVGLIGPNGAGKTTFIDAITGFVPASCSAAEAIVADNAAAALAEGMAVLSRGARSWFAQPPASGITSTDTAIARAAARFATTGTLAPRGSCWESTNGR